MSGADQLQDECWNKAIYACGTAYLVGREFQSIKMKRQIITFLGIGVPVLVGGMAFTHADYPDFFSKFLLGAGILSVAQLVVSVWSLTANWDDFYEKCSQSLDVNTDLEVEWQNAARNNPPDSEISKKVEFLRVRDLEQQKKDKKLGISETKFRRGLRYALRQYKRSCVQCGEVPASMKPTACPVCGDF